MRSTSPLMYACFVAVSAILTGCGSATFSGNTNIGSGAVPTVTAVGQQINGVAANRKQEVQFSEDMNASTINAQTFTVADSSGKSVTGLVTYDSNNHVASFQPNPALQSNASYTATVTTGVTSAGGVHLPQAYSYQFTTRATSDSSPLEVEAVSPAAGATCVSATMPIVITFDESPDVSTLTSTNIVVKGPDGSALKTTISLNVSQPQVTVTPASPLPSGTITVMIQNVADLAGVAMTAPYMWSFSTACNTGGGGGGSSNGAEYLYSSAFAEGGNIYGYKIDMATGNLMPIPGSPFMEDAGPPMGCTVGCYVNLVADPVGRFLFYSTGVGTMKVDPATGKLSEVGNYPPSDYNIGADPSGKWIYANQSGCGCTGPNAQVGAILGWKINPDGSLSTTSGSPYNYGSSSQNGSQGSPGISGNFVFVTDTGINSSTIHGFKIDQNTGALTQVSTTPDGNGGTLALITPNGKFLYSEQNYLNGNTYDMQIVGFVVNADGSLTPMNMQPIQTPDQIVTNIEISPNGKFLYEFGKAGIRIYRIDPNSGVLTQTTMDSTNKVDQLTFDPTNQYAFGSPASTQDPNWATNQIQGYSVDPNTGAISPISTSTAILPNYPGVMAIVRPQ